MSPYHQSVSTFDALSYLRPRHFGASLSKGSVAKDKHSIELQMEALASLTNGVATLFQAYDG